MSQRTWIQYIIFAASLRSCIWQQYGGGRGFNYLLSCVFSFMAFTLNTYWGFGETQEVTSFYLLFINSYLYSHPPCVHSLPAPPDKAEAKKYEILMLQETLAKIYAILSSLSRRFYHYLTHLAMPIHPNMVSVGCSFPLGCLGASHSSLLITTS